MSVPSTAAAVQAPTSASSDLDTSVSPRPLQPPADHSAQAESLATSLRAHAQRLRVAKVRADFEHTVLTVLTLNVLYAYYLDHTLLLLAIRVSQVVRLLYLPYAAPPAQRGTAVLLVLTTIPVLVIHHILLAHPSSDMGDMLFINFIGPEPKSFAKLLVVDLIIMALQAVLLQCKWGPASFRPLAALPVPADTRLVSLHSHSPTPSPPPSSSPSSPSPSPPASPSASSSSPPASPRPQSRPSYSANARVPSSTDSATEVATVAAAAAAAAASVSTPEIALLARAT